ncbi:MAG: hypothetical protein ACXVZL_06190 [Gaiellaceae bacterium]
MKKSIAALFVIALTLALALFTGTALAGGNHGGGHDGTAGSQPQQSQPAQQDSHASKQDSTVQTGGDNSHGVKPSSATNANPGHDTHATAGSGYTKQYGNGKTAGQIAEQNGAKPDTVLHGPGNSQPHKVALCPGGHERDVHALKGGTGSCAPAEQHVEHAVKQVEHVQKPVEHVSSETKSVSHETKSSENEKVYICHATGSSTNPYVLIHVSKHAEWAHTHHQGDRDVVLGSTLSSGTTCPAAPAAPTQAVAGEQKTEEQVCTQQQQVQVATGVKHFIGPKGSGRFVIIHPSTNSAHYENKHPDEIVWETRTIDVKVPCPAAPAAASTPPAVVTPQAPQTQAPVVAPATPAPLQTPAPVAAPTGGVAGAQASVPASQSSAPTASPTSTGGVLGAQATLRPRTSPHGGVLGTIRSTTLPFTGLPLWPVLLGALALIGAGAAVRRTQRGTL